MLSKEVTKLLNEQINKEFYSSYLYLDMSNYYDLKNLNGFANWFKVQAQEERDHALLFMNYLQNNNEEIKLTAIAAPDKAYNDFKAPLEASLQHERMVTASIYNIYEEASKQRDFRTLQFLNWFVTEQGEEEKNAEDLIDRYELFGYDAKSLYLLDAELAARVYAAPTLVLD
ncbi:MAG: ferritin [Bacillota bacterium]|jgi:ferritin|nr:ferritin [Bacillota bacterium]